MARRGKPPLSAWLVENRKRLGLKPEDIALRLDVSPTTVRGWEAGRSISPENVAKLETVFGVAAPVQEPTADLGELVAAINRLADQVEAERAERLRWERGWITTLRAALAGQLPAELLDALVPQRPGDAQQ